MIYADNAIEPSKNVTNGGGGEYISTWINNPSKNFIAVTLDEFRANWKYNFGDDKMQSFLSKTPIYNQWDDHEVRSTSEQNEPRPFTCGHSNKSVNLTPQMPRWQTTGGQVK